MKNILSIQVLDGLTFDLSINHVIQKTYEEREPEFFLYLLKRISEYKYQRHSLLFTSEDATTKRQVEKRDVKNEIDNYYYIEIQHRLQYNNVISKTLRFRTEHHQYELLKFTSSNKGDLLGLLALSRETSNEDAILETNQFEGIIQHNIRLKVEPSTMDYMNFMNHIELNEGM